MNQQRLELDAVTVLCMLGIIIVAAVCCAAGVGIFYIVLA